MKTHGVIDICKVAMLYLRDSPFCGTAFGKRVEGLIRSRSAHKLAALTDEPEAHSELQMTIFCSQMAAFFKKNIDYAVEKVCDASARLSFDRAERLCRITNRRLDWYALRPERLDDVRSAQISKMRRVISEVCGSHSRWLGVLPESIRVTSGATSETSRERSVPYMKVRKSIACTSGAWPYVEALSKYYIGRAPKFHEVCHNRIVTVSKSISTNRTIAAEPAGNLPVQLSVDSWLKKRLRKCLGIDLSSQRKNQEMARSGSITGKLATIDLSMASDTLAYNVVPYLFPEDWYMTLHRLRTPCYKGKFGEGTYAKFSSMGNGFTFTVETLVFAAACVAVGSEDFTVYGDDIILESHLYGDVCALLRYLGFVPNLTKSFAEGPFRESCGKDYFEGVDTRPFYYRGQAATRADLAHHINGLVGISVPHGALWEYLRKGVLEAVRQKAHLPLVPHNDSTESGVHVDANTAYRIGVIRVRFGGLHFFKGLTRKAKSKRATSFGAAGVRGLILWYIQRLSSSDVEVSRTPDYDQQVVLTRLHWRIPVEGVPPHLYAWSDYLMDGFSRLGERTKRSAFVRKDQSKQSRKAA